MGRRGRFQQVEENATAMQDVQLTSEGFCPFPRLSCGVAIVSDQKLEAQSLRQIDAKTLSTLECAPELRLNLLQLARGTGSGWLQDNCFSIGSTFLQCVLPNYSYKIN